MHMNDNCAVGADQVSVERPWLRSQDAVCIFTGLAIFLISLVISPQYQGGDQIYYRKAYELIAGMDVHEARALYQTQMGTVEWGHFVVMWLGSSLDIGKDLYVSVLNACLAMKLMEWMLRNKARVSIACGIVLTNYYLYVAYFAAERLKIALLLLVFAWTALPKMRSFLGFSLAALATHLSIAILLVGSYVRLSVGSVRGRVWMYLLLFALLAVIMGYCHEYLAWKIGFYMEHRPAFRIMSFVPALALFAMSLYYGGNLIEPLCDFAVLFVLMIFIGTSQLNIFAWFLFIRFGLRKNGGFNVGMVATILYLAVKTVPFVQDVFVTGQGFSS
ncbi:hypothetical protein ACIPEN_00645 [Herbaspirillum chlorophenolicum]|uniref:EpsG family protein n=1 Tax=Herbaspirillum chlorophenolicum TaxID=211589 RepID=A0ABW8ES83_9BURK